MNNDFVIKAINNGQAGTALLLIAVALWIIVFRLWDTSEGKNTKKTSR